MVVRGEEGSEVGWGIRACSTCSSGNSDEDCESVMGGEDYSQESSAFQVDEMCIACHRRPAGMARVQAQVEVQVEVPVQAPAQACISRD
jgi:hypothetical protein